MSMLKHVQGTKNAHNFPHRRRYELFLVCTLLLLLLCQPFANAQQETVSGQVTSADGNAPIPGATVMLKGSNTGTVTDLNGNFSIPVPERNGILVFSFVGYE